MPNTTSGYFHLIPTQFSGGEIDSESTEEGFLGLDPLLSVAFPLVLGVLSFCLGFVLYQCFLKDMAILPERREKQQRLISAGRRESIAIDEIFHRSRPTSSKAETILSTDATNIRGDITDAEPWPDNENFSLCYQDPTRIVMDWEHKSRREALGSYKDHTLIEKRKVRYPRSQNKPNKPRLVKVSPASPTQSTHSRVYPDIPSEGSISRNYSLEAEKLSPRHMQKKRESVVRPAPDASPRHFNMHNLLDAPINEYDWEPLSGIPMSGSDIPDCLSALSETSSIIIENSFPDDPINANERFPDTIRSNDSNCSIENSTPYENTPVIISVPVDQMKLTRYSTPKPPDVSNLISKTKLKSYETPIDQIAPLKQMPSTATKGQSTSPSPGTDEELSRPNGFEFYKDHGLILLLEESLNLK